MRVSAFIPWINATIIGNGGMASCGFTLSAPPSLGKSGSNTHDRQLYNSNSGSVSMSFFIVELAVNIIKGENIK